MSDNAQIPVESLSPDEANRIIHSHRKVRYGKTDPNSSMYNRLVKTCSPESQSNCLLDIIGTACWPCRQRKVKCDNKQPCENCVKRDHASLCSYNPKQHVKKPSGSIIGTKRARSPASDGSPKKEDDRWPRTTGKSFHQRFDLAAFYGERTSRGLFGQMILMLRFSLLRARFKFHK